MSHPPGHFPRIDPSDPVPVWKQIEEGLRRLVAAGHLRPGEAVPSVRDLAVRLRVNPATAAKACQALVLEGLLQVRRGDGTYVSERLPVSTAGRVGKAVREAAGRYAAVAITSGLSPGESIDAVREAIDGLGAADGKARPSTGSETGGSQ